MRSETDGRPVQDWPALVTSIIVFGFAGKRVSSYAIVAGSSSSYLPVLRHLVAWHSADPIDELGVRAWPRRHDDRFHLLAQRWSIPRPPSGMLTRRFSI